tara:strand:+ start:686 stop:868 length:183 start_codon:yes stop_codon:yes gene_type:complete
MKNINLTLEEYSNFLQLFHFINLQVKSETIKLDNDFAEKRLYKITEAIQKDLNNLTIKNK